MTPQLASDIAHLDRLTPDELLLEISIADLAAATGTETDDDRAYRAELEKRARTKETETEMDTICRRVGCVCCPTAAYCQNAAVTEATIRFPGETPTTGRTCGQCAADLQALQARIDRRR